MRYQKNNPGEIIGVGLANSQFPAGQMVTLIRTRQIQVMQLVLPEGMTLPAHEFPGEMVVHCLEGRVSLASASVRYELQGGQLLYCLTDEAFTIKGLEAATLLLIVALPNEGEASQLVG